MKVVKCKPYVRFTSKEMNPNCYAYRGSYYKPFAVYEVLDSKWKMELGDYLVPIKEYLHDKLWYVWQYFYMKDQKKIANAISRLMDKIDPIPF